MGREDVGVLGRFGHLVLDFVFLAGRELEELHCTVADTLCCSLCISRFFLFGLQRHTRLLCW